MGIEVEVWRGDRGGGVVMEVGTVEVGVEVW